jgi:hypothetical protein
MVAYIAVAIAQANAVALRQSACHNDGTLAAGCACKLGYKAIYGIQRGIRAKVLRHSLRGTNQAGNPNAFGHFAGRCFICRQGK